MRRETPLRKQNLRGKQMIGPLLPNRRCEPQSHAVTNRQGSKGLLTRLGSQGKTGVPSCGTLSRQRLLVITAGPLPIGVMWRLGCTCHPYDTKELGRSSS